MKYRWLCQCLGLSESPPLTSATTTKMPWLQHRNYVSEITKLHIIIHKISLEVFGSNSRQVGWPK